MMDTEVNAPEIRTPGFCALCKSRCGSVMVTRGGRLVGQEPNPVHPTGQALCIKGKAAPEIVYSPQRQLYPLMRTRPKGDPDPGWRRISWEEALDCTAKALNEIRAESGPEAVAFGWTTPSGTPISDDIRWVERFTNAFGSPNIAYGTEICNWHKDYAHAYTFGRSIASPDFANSGCIVLWGHNPSATWLDHATATGSARAKGAKLVVVDPRKAGFAGRADQWLRVRPGADGALALAIAGEMIRNDWYDAEFLRDWSNGPLLVRRDTNRFLRVKDLAEPLQGAEPEDLIALDSATGQPVFYRPETRCYPAGAETLLEGDFIALFPDGAGIPCRTAFGLYRDLCDEFPPERTAELTWVEGTQITATARLLYEARPVCYYAWSGVGQHTNATQMDRAIAILMALTGSFDAPGGNVEFTKPAARDVTGGEFLSKAQRDKCIGLSRSALGPSRNGWIDADTLYEAILDEKPYPIRGLFGFGRNFLVNHAGGERGAEALSRLKFHVQTDTVLSPTAAYADIFLPVNTPWERESLRVGFEGTQAAESLIQLRQAAIPSLGETRSDGEIVFELAQRLGFGEKFWNGDIRAGFRAILEPLGITLENLMENPNGISTGGEPHYYRYRRTGMKTPSGKIEIFSETFADHGQDPLPRFVEPAASPFRGRRRDYPLVLTSAKQIQFCHGQHRHIPSLRKRSPDPEISLHPETAAERGIADGDWVEIRSPHGCARMRAKLDPALDPRVVCGQYGWWQENQTLNLPAFDPASDQGANFNRLIDVRASDPISGSNGLRSSICDIIRVESLGQAGWRGWRRFIIDSIERESPDIVSFRLKPCDGEKLPEYRGGQHLTLRIENGEETPLVRCYSLSGPSGGDSYRVSVKLAEGGKMSSHLHSLTSLPPPIVELQAPKGTFHLGCAAAGSEQLVLVAAGIGITPLLAMLYELQAMNWPGEVRLLYGVRALSDYAFGAELKALGIALPRLQVIPFHSRLAADTLGIRAGRITAEAVLAACAPGSPIFLCGPPGMIESLTTGLRAAGVPAERLHLEAFGPSSLKPAAAIGSPQLVTLQRSGISLVWRPESGSLLTAIEQAGGKPASGCRSGQCESCAVRLLHGQVAHPNGTAAIDTGICLPCVAIPLSPVTLDA